MISKQLLSNHLDIKSVVQVSSLIKHVKESELSKRIANGAFWSFTGTALAKFIVLVAGIVCAHILNKEQYGQFGLVRSTINMFVVFGVAGLGVTATKHISQYRSQYPERVSDIYILTNGTAWLTGMIVTALVLFFAPFIAVNLLHSPELVTSIRIGGLLLFVTVLNGAQTGTLSGFENFKAIAINTLIGSIAESIFMLIGAYYYGISGAILGYGTGYIALYISNFLSIRKIFNTFNIRIRFSSFDKHTIPLLYKYSLPAMLSSMMIPLIYWTIRTLLANNSGFDELAIYEASDQWKTIIMFIPGAVSQIILPILSNTMLEGDKQFWRVLKINIIINGGISFIFAGIVCLFSSTIISLYGNDYCGGEPTLIILAISTIFSSLANVVGIALYSRSKMWVGFICNSFWAIMIIGFSYWFIQLGMGSIGLALAISLSYFIHTAIQLTYLIYCIHHDHKLRSAS